MGGTETDPQRFIDGRSRADLADRLTDQPTTLNASPDTTGVHPVVSLADRSLLNGLFGSQKHRRNN